MKTILGDLVKDPPSILEDTPYSNSFPAQYALIDSQCDKHGKNYWLSGSGGRYFIIDMAYHFIPNQIVLRNAHNGGYNDRYIELNRQSFYLFLFRRFLFQGDS